MQSDGQIEINGTGLARSLAIWVPVSALVGAVVIVAFALNHGRLPPLRTVAYGSLIGTLSCAWCFALLRLLQALLNRLPKPWFYVGIATTFAFGGWLGWYTAAAAAGPFLGVRVIPNLSGISTDLFITGTAAAGVGIAIFVIETLKDRIRLNVIQLKEQEYARKELELAGAIQRRLLPASRIELNGFRVNACHTPARYVAGDFFDVFQLDERRAGLVIADVAGKGMGASLIMASVKTMVPFLASAHSVTDTMYRLNERLCDELASREFVALLLARFDPSDGSMEIANAGLPDPYLLQPDRAPQALAIPQPRLPLGCRRHISYQPLQLQLDHGDRLLLITDGMPEALTSNNVPLGYEAFEAQLARAQSSAPPHDLLDHLTASVHEATRDEQDDDWTAVHFERV